MASKRKRDSFDALTSRIFILLIGLTFVAVGSFMLSWSGETETTSLIIGWTFSIGGIVVMFCGLALGDENAIKFSEKTGHHEVLILYAVLSMALAWIIRRARIKT